MAYYALGQLPSAKDIVVRAYGHDANPITPETISYSKLVRDGRIAYELAVGKFGSMPQYGVYFAQIDERGRFVKMPRSNGLFPSEAAAKEWIRAIENSGGQAS
jgi:hypothetical protein